MSSILLAGLTEPEAAALEILVGMHWRDWQTVTLKRSLSLSIPEQTSAARACKVCVVDLFGFGMRRHTPEQEQRLKEFLNGRNAILLVWGSGGGWAENVSPDTPEQQLECVKVPYTSVAIRGVLNRMLGDQPAGKAAAAPRKKPAAAAEQPAEKSAAAVTGTATADRLQALNAAFPQLATMPLIKLAGKITQPGSAFLAHASGEPVLISNAALGTVASPSTEAVLLKSLQTQELQAGMRIASVALEQFDETRRKYLGRTQARMEKALDVFAWELAESALRGVKLERRADLSLRLRYMPNFTVMGGGDAMDVQLAAICIRTPQSISMLAQSFPRQEERVNRFAALAVLSGLAEITQAPPVQPKKVTLAAPRSRSAAPAPKGFFRSLLAKLF